MAGLHARTLLAAFVVAAVAPTFAQQPTTAPATLTLRGVVVTANDVPLPRVRVGIASVLSQQAASLGISQPSSERGVLTDDRGRFTIQVPATTTIRLAFTKARYTTQAADIAPRDFVARGSEIRVRMPLAGAISGQVLDRSGARLSGAIVQLQRVGAAATATPLSATRTNDLGEYRFGGLAEGRYVVTARPSVFALGGDIADRQAIVDAAAVAEPGVNVSAGVEAENITLSIDAPSELDQDALNRRPDPDPEATGSVSGRVVTWDGTPIARAVVHAYRPFIPGRQVETDERGRYRIDRLIPGEYTVEVRKSGFNSEQYALDRTPITGRGRSIAIKKDQAIGSVDVRLVRGAVIAGTIVDEFGEAAQDVIVSAFQIQAVGGRTLRASGRRGARTDDRGQYRIGGLEPGSYVVEAVVGDALSAGNGYLPQFYPGTLVIDQAALTKVDFDTAVTGIDLTLIPTAAHRVTGVVIDSSGRPGRGSVVLAVSARSGAIQRDYVDTEIRADGSFEFSNVGPGDYVVQANGVVAGSGQQFATSLVTVVGSDPPPVQLRVSLGATLRGRVTYEGVPPGPSPLLDLLAIPTDHDRAPLRGNSSTDVFIKGDGSLEFKGLFGPTLIQARPQRNDWYLKSVVFKGQDLTDTPFDFGTGGTFSGIEVVISAYGATVTGRVTDDRGIALPVSDVLVFSTLSDRWNSGSRWVKAERLRVDGTFTVTGLPPGDYWVVAVARVGNAAGGAPLTDPDVLESLSPRAVRITLGEGQSQDLALRLVRR